MLSAVEGLEVVEPSLEHLVVPIAVAILIGLFAVQRFGTGAVGRALRAGDARLVHRARRRRLHGIADHPASCEALSPTYARRSSSPTTG